MQLNILVSIIVPIESYHRLQVNIIAKMSEIGVISPPEGEIADFHHTSSLQVTILSVYISTSVLATIGLVLRLYTGAILVRNLGLDACKYLWDLQYPAEEKKIADGKKGGKKKRNVPSNYQ